MLTLLAQSQPVAPSLLPYLIVGIVVVGLTAILQVAVLTKQLFGGNKGERQIEPTQIAAIQAELKDQTKVLNKIDREVAGALTTVASLEKQMDGMHHRVGSISRDLAGAVARVDGLEKREGRQNA